jgi:hypothetical protein
MHSPTRIEQVGDVLVAANKLPLAERVDAHAEALTLLYEAVRELAGEVRALREGRPPPGAVARY